MAHPWPPYVFLLAEVLLTGAFMLFLPNLTRQDLFFAVTVAPEFRATSTGRAILGSFRRELTLHTLIATALVASGFLTFRFGLAMTGMLWQVIGLIAAFLRARRRVMPHASPVATVREAQVEFRATRTEIPLLLRIGFPLPLAFLAAVGWYLRSVWDRIPDRFPTHWDIAGNPNRWSDKSPEGVFGGLLMAASVSGVLWLAAYITLRWSRRIHATGPAAEQEDRFRVAVATCLFLASLLIVATTAWGSLLALRPDAEGPPTMTWLLGVVVLFMIVIVTLLVRNRPGRIAPPPGAPVGDRTEDRYWKAGLFYVNPDDPALLIEKRFGIGYTLNFGHVWAWLLIGALVGAPWLIMLIVPML